VLDLLARPLTRYRATILVAMILLFIGGFSIGPLRTFYALDLPRGHVLAVALLIAFAALLVLEVGWTWWQHRLPPERRTPRIERAEWRISRRPPP
jgi:hypothetical protein